MILDACHMWIALLWLLFLVYWAVAAPFTKRTIDRGLSGAGLPVRLLLVAVVFAAFIVGRRSPELRAVQLAELRSIPMAVVGAAITTLGAAVAFTARAVIGRNWGTPGSRKEDSELVTSGPYSLIRHPIYSGVLLMMIGTAIGLMPAWWLVFAVSTVYFLSSARREEGLMTERFPDIYPAYKARTKMLLPFIL